jgi:hypothetical protein
VQVSISGVSFTVRFSPQEETSKAIAERLCREQADRIGVTNENFPTCIERVSGYLQNQVDAWYDEKYFSTPLNLSGTQFDIRFIPEIDSPTKIAQKLCLENQVILGLTTETGLNNCITPVANYLTTKVRSWYEEKTLNIPVTIDNFEFQVTFMPERQSSIDMSTKLCQEHATTLQLTDALYPTCIENVNAYLRRAVNAWVASKTLDFQMIVNQKPYQFSFLPERETAETVASRFCIEQATDFQLTKDNIIPACIAPMTKRINTVIENWINSKVITVPLLVADQKIDLQFIPERESTMTVARRFCNQQINLLGLTNENFTRDCVEPVIQRLQEAVMLRAQQQQQQQQQAKTM